MQVPREKANINQPRRKTSQPTGLEPGMDYLINADVCPGIGCRRKVLDAVFENETAESDHHKCNTSLKTGCLRCLIMPPSICCDIHTPEHFTSFMSIIPKSTKQSSCSRITKFSMASIDFKLVDALEDWREDTTQKLYGQAHLHDLGPGLVMPNDILDCIVDCAHFHKIKSPTDLLKETHWSGVDEHGDDIVALILRVSPLPSPSTPFISTPLQPRQVSSNTTTTSALLFHDHVQGFPVSKRKARCSACGEEGHNGMYPELLASYLLTLSTKLVTVIVESTL
ncbi:hypothetical protein C8R48DRAFT_607597 [Suillus tomentosus]|nr:hypothetical protein C8R48DRAFT_607597 [Suillus tomentosus]